MLKKMMNSARIKMKINPVDPLLIKSGQANVGGVDMAFVRTYKYGEKEEPFIPGSSMKGMIRSYAEKICRSLRDKPVPVCLPYVDVGKEDRHEKDQASCGLRISAYKKKKPIPSPKIYSLSCPVCRLFGSHEFIGRCSASDAYLTADANKPGGHVLEIRDGVAIDRFTGGAAKGAKYDLEVLTKGEFETVLDVRNFERWQMGLLGLVIRDMEEGLVRLGFGKSRGLGRFQAQITEFHLGYYAKPAEHFTGIAGICTPEECSAYGFFAETQQQNPLPQPKKNGLRYEYDITANWKTVLEPAVADLVGMIGNLAWPKNIDQFLGKEA